MQYAYSYQTIPEPPGGDGSWEERAIGKFDDAMTECKSPEELGDLLEELLSANLTGSLNNKGVRAREWAVTELREMLTVWTDKHRDMVYRWAEKQS